MFFKSNWRITLVEALVAGVLILILVGISLPAIQRMRESSRRMNCQRRMTELAVAVSTYQTRMSFYPCGTTANHAPIVNEPSGYHHNWISSILADLNEDSVFESIDFEVSVYDRQNSTTRGLRIPKLICPTSFDLAHNTTCYAGIHASTETPIDSTNDGFFLLNRTLSEVDIADGLDYTIMIGEKLSAQDQDLGWMSGTRSSLRNVGHAINANRDRIRGSESSDSQSPLFVGGLASDHPGGVYIAKASSQSLFVSTTMDHRVLEQLASRSDGANTVGD